MAKLVKSMEHGFEASIQKVKTAVMNGSITATLEDEWFSSWGNSRCAVMVFERYSNAGGNRVSMNVTLYQDGNSPVQLCAITSGGSQAMFFKLNTWGEETFLDTLRDGL